MLLNTDINLYCTFSWNRSTSRVVPSRQRSHPLVACFTPFLACSFRCTCDTTCPDLSVTRRLESLEGGSGFQCCRQALGTVRAGGRSRLSATCRAGFDIVAMNVDMQRLPSTGGNTMCSHREDEQIA